MRKGKKYLIPGLIILAILLIGSAIFFGRPKTPPTIVRQNDLGAASAQAQTYAASQTPVLSAEDMIFGSPQAPLKIFVYEDYADLYSARLADNLDKVRADFGSQVAIVVRPYILKSSPLAEPAAQAVFCAGEQNKWAEMRALLFAQTKINHLSLASFPDYAQQIGLNQGDFQVCLTNSQKSKIIEQSAEAAAQYQVSGAPTIFVGSQIILGARPYEAYTDSNGDKIEGLKQVVANLVGK